jgi:universal stress protein F
MYKNIVVPIDLSDSFSWKSAFPVALSFVRIFGAELHLIHIIPDLGISMFEEYIPHTWISAQKEKYSTQLDRLIAQHVPNEIKVKKFIGRGPVYDGIINYAESVKADLLIVPAIRPQLQDYMLGSNVSKIVRHAKISVLVVRD